MPWLQLILESEADQSQALADALAALGAAAVTLQDGADQPLYEPPPGETPLWARTRVVGLFESTTDVDGVVARLQAALGGAQLPPYRIEALEDRDWTREWMARYQPMRFGERLWICPSWREPPVPEAVNILLDPGLAFGTGTHPTTALCLRWLDGAPVAGRTVLDYGCGSGILAIAAAKLGAAEVWAVDNDPQALLATRDNAQRNRVDGRIATFAPAELPDIRVQMVLANILAGPLIGLAPRLAQHSAPGGYLVLSGILAEQGAEVAAAYRQWFELAKPAELEGWLRLEGRRSQPTPPGGSAV